jgi:hypothetical protein
MSCSRGVAYDPSVGDYAATSPYEWGGIFGGSFFVGKLRRAPALQCSLRRSGRDAAAREAVT